MLHFLYFFLCFLFLNFWSSVQAAVAIAHAIPDDFLGHFSRLGIGRSIIRLPENPLRIEEIGAMQNIPAASLSDRFYTAITDRKSLWDLYQEDKLTIRKLVDGSIDCLNPIPSELDIAVKGLDIADASLLLDLVEGRNFFPTLVMNLKVHEQLAGLSSSGNPLAQWYIAKLLKHFSVKQDDDLGLASQRLAITAKRRFEALLEDREIPFSLKGLFCEYLGDQSRASGFFEEGAKIGEAFAHYKIGQMRERLGEDDALDYYEMAFILGYEKALCDLGRYHTDDNVAFLTLKKAAERGNAEAYFLIAQMTREGFIPLGYSNDEAFWLEKGAELGSLSCGFALGELQEKRHNFPEAINVYAMLASSGSIEGFLEQGKIKENERDFGTCETIYKTPQSGWFGLYALADITPEKDAKETLKEAAARMFHAHFERIIEIATSGSNKE